MRARLQVGDIVRVAREAREDGGVLRADPHGEGELEGVEGEERGAGVGREVPLVPEGGGGHLAEVQGQQREGGAVALGDVGGEARELPARDGGVLDRGGVAQVAEEAGGRQRGGGRQQAVVLRRPRRAAPGGEGAGHELVDLLAAVAGEADQHLGALVLSLIHI